MYAGCVACCPLVSYGEYADGTDVETDRRYDGLTWLPSYWPVLLLVTRQRPLPPSQQQQQQPLPSHQCITSTNISLQKTSRASKYDTTWLRDRCWSTELATTGTYTPAIGRPTTARSGDTSSSRQHSSTSEPLTKKMKKKRKTRTEHAAAVEETWGVRTAAEFRRRRSMKTWCVRACCRRRRTDSDTGRRVGTDRDSWATSACRSTSLRCRTWTHRLAPDTHQRPHTLQRLPVKPYIKPSRSSVVRSTWSQHLSKSTSYCWKTYLSTSKVLCQKFT